MRARLLLLSALALGCGSTKTVETSDASTSSAPDPLMNELRSFPALAKVMPTQGRLSARDGHFSLATSGFRPIGVPSNAVKLPTRSERPVHLDGTSGSWLELVDLDVRSVVGSEDGPALGFRAVRVDTDLAWIAAPDRFEDVHVLRSERAPRTLRYRVRLSPGLSLAAKGDHVEAIDGAGRARFVALPAFAVDARGTRRDLALGLEADELVVRVDTAGLVFPVAVDPTWRITSTDPPAITNEGTTLIAWDDRHVFYGALGSPTAGATFDAGSEVWTNLTTGSPRYYRDGRWVPSINRIVLGGGSDGSVWTNLVEVWNPATPAVTATTTLNVERGRHTAELVAGTPERVMFIGGQSSTAYLATTEWWDASTGVSSYRASMGAARASHASSTIGAGKILVTGGFDGSTSLSTAEVYDATTNAWVATTNTMSVARSQHRQVTLLTGKVLVLGGTNGGVLSSAELYDPTSKTFTTTSSMTSARMDPSATLMADGKVLVAGGYDPSVGDLSTTEIYDPTTAKWSPGPNLSTPRWRHGAVLLSGGRVLVGPGGTALRAEILWPDGITCTSSSGGCTCVDGYCCDRPCTEQCNACDLPGKKGVCAPVDGEAPHGLRTSCGTFPNCQLNPMTNVSACMSFCFSDASCATGNYCNAGACLPKKSNGAACTRLEECTSGNCVDGVCCNTACPGVCEACAESGSSGTCSPISGDPRGTRAPCFSGYACKAGTCTSSCTTNSDCATGRYCTSALTCVIAKAFGSSCTSNGECFKGNCVDGVCCDTACTESCKACNLTGLAGTCSPVASGAPVGSRTCPVAAVCTAGACASGCTKDADCATANYCSSGGSCVPKKSNGNGCGTANECTSGFCASGVCCNSACTGECQSCNGSAGVGVCGAAPAATSCGRAGCVGAATVTVGKCSGTDATCNPGTIAPCADGLKCADAFACLTQCTTGADCLSGVCDTATKKCATSWDGGVPETGPSETGTSDAGVAESPAPSVDPKPVVGSFQKCTKNSECSTGFCVEGICCDTACTDKCYSCSLLATAGKCTLEPIGVDLKNECGPTNTCLGTCDGKGACIGAGKGTMCARNRCTGASAGIGPSYCSAPGATCTTDEASPFDCSPFVCEPAFGACRTSCVSSNDCANGFVCDLASKLCIAAPTVASVDATEDSGCGCSFRKTSDGRALALLLALMLVRRQRAKGGRDSTSSRSS